MPPTLTVLVYSAGAALCGGLGVLPLLGRDRLPIYWIGLSNALAGGMMLGFAFLLTTADVAAPPLFAALGAVGGIAFTYWTHAFQGTGDLDLNLIRATDQSYAYKIFLIHFLHSASEGVAIGVAMVIDLSFGMSMALAIAIHNIAEAAVFSSILRSLGAGVVRSATLGALTNAGQVLLAVVTFAVINAAPSLLPWALGFAVGALVYLVLVELLPESYHEAAHSSVAVVALVAMGTVVLLGRLLP